MSYTVKEIFHSLQGEGFYSGRAALFCRFAGCNLWSGRDEERAKGVCQFCDTDFLGVTGPGGGRFATAQALVTAISHAGPKTGGDGDNRFVVLTGGEPLLQVDAALLTRLHAQGFEVAIETNGTLKPPAGIDWICVSPKAGSEWLVRAGNELKLVFPQSGIDPKQLLTWDFDHFFIQPMDGSDYERNTRMAVDYCLAHPQWRLSLQVHKVVGIS